MVYFIFIESTMNLFVSLFFIKFSYYKCIINVHSFWEEKNDIILYVSLQIPFQAILMFARDSYKQSIHVCVWAFSSIFVFNCKIVTFKTKS